MTSKIYTGTLTGPEGGPYRVVHDLDTWHVEVTLQGYVITKDDMSVLELPQGAGIFRWTTETENSIIIDTTIEDGAVQGGTPSPGARLVANGMTVVVRAVE